MWGPTGPPGPGRPAAGRHDHRPSRPGVPDDGDLRDRPSRPAGTLRPAARVTRAALGAPGQHCLAAGPAGGGRRSCYGHGSGTPAGRRRGDLCRSGLGRAALAHPWPLHLLVRPPITGVAAAGRLDHPHRRLQPGRDRGRRRPGVHAGPAAGQRRAPFSGWPAGSGCAGRRRLGPSWCSASRRSPWACTGPSTWTTSPPRWCWPPFCWCCRPLTWQFWQVSDRRTRRYSSSLAARCSSWSVPPTCCTQPCGANSCRVRGM